MRWYVSVFGLSYRYYNFSTSINQQTDEAKLQAAKRRAEREAVDYKQRVLGFVFLTDHPFPY